MLINASHLLKYPILSLHVGGKVAEVTEIVVNPNDLRIIACRVEGPLVGKEFGDILPIESVREFSRLGMIIDSTDELVESNEIVRIKEILDLNFSLFGLKVITKAGTKIGKVSDFTLDPSFWDVNQIVVERPFFKSLIDPELIISRQHIVEVDDFRVVIDDDKKHKTQVASKASPVSNFVNPFRNQEVSPRTSAQHSKRQPRQR